MPDARAAEPVRYPMADPLMSGFGMMFFQHPSLLNLQRAQEKEQQRCNLQTIFKVRAVPSDRPMWAILDGAPTEPLRARRPAWFEKMRRAGCTSQFKTGVAQKVGRSVPYTKREEYYTVALDGSEYFHSTARRRSRVRVVCARRRRKRPCTTAIR